MNILKRHRKTFGVVMIALTVIGVPLASRYVDFALLGLIPFYAYVIMWHRWVLQDLDKIYAEKQRQSEKF
jgi:hypothetical protein